MRVPDTTDVTSTVCGVVVAGAEESDWRWGVYLKMLFTGTRVYLNTNNTRVGGVARPSFPFSFFLK